MERGEDDDDVVCLDGSFFINDNYQLATFTFGSQVLELYCLQSASRCGEEEESISGHPKYAANVIPCVFLVGTSIFSEVKMRGLTIHVAADFDLTGQMVWPGAELLNNYLSKNSEMLKGCSVIELGSGVGITGMLCSRFCSEVVMTDHSDEVLKILTRNIQLHHSSKNSVHSAGLKSEKLEWGNSEQLNYILQKHPEGFDLVLGADICFQQSSIPWLFATVERLLRASNNKKCKFILAYVSRTKVMDDMVLREASQHELRVTEVAGTRTTIRDLGGVIYEITCA